VASGHVVVAEDGVKRAVLALAVVDRIDEVDVARPIRVRVETLALRGWR